MSYFGVLFLFILPPIVSLVVIVPSDLWRRLFYGRGSVHRELYLALLAHVVIALLYTTPWDNFLVAQGVWWYNPGLVSGIVFGWVPLEEYIFFVLQTILTGLWCLALMRYIYKTPEVFTANGRLRIWSGLLTILIWCASIATLSLGWQPGRYLALILVWALPPVFFQLVVGADILFANWRLIVFTLLPTTFYLWVVDAIAIRSGTWTIDPLQTIGIALGPLPLEEMIFFLLTNLMITFGMTLMLAPHNKARLHSWFASLFQVGHRSPRISWRWLVRGLERER